MKHTPRYYQVEAVDALFEYFKTDDATHPLIELATGAGKSLVQAMIAERIIKDYPECRILFLTHQQELIRQNFNELISSLGFVDAGIYSAGLNCRDTDNKIIFAGIQSVYKKALELGRFNLIVIDEAHLLSKKSTGMYRKFLDDMFSQAYFCKVVGLTATPYRLDSGLLTEGEGKIFDEIIYKSSIARLVKEGYLCELIGKQGIVKPDLSGVHKRGGEYVEKELNEACDNDILIEKAVGEFLSLTHDRNHVLIFCSGIAHANHVRDEVRAQGQGCMSVHSDMSDAERNQILNGFRDGSVRYLTNCDMLTTGFNARHIDCIIMLRPTASVGLYYQMCGRGLRTDEVKKNCLILDYAGNILAHGPIDKIEVKDKGRAGERGVQSAPMKECPKCKEPVPIQLAVCPFCSYEWPVNVGHEATAGEGSPLSKYVPPREIELAPEDTSYFIHEKEGRLSMKVAYTIGVLESLSEWVCIEHGGFAERKAREWLREALPEGYPIPDTVEDCMGMTGVYKRPSSIFVDFNQRFPRILSRVYPDDAESFDEVCDAPAIEKITRGFIR